MLPREDGGVVDNKLKVKVYGIMHPLLSADTLVLRYTGRRTSGLWTFQLSLFTSQHTRKVRDIYYALL
jgi:hypothetical protein